ncbi:glycosyltransferase [Candidatus Woesearchaeota archaeon]|nr:glycosyltransferase [Candidatus Woesearchaeota archaeon]
MKFSILIPTLNEEKFIGNLLHSLNRQTFKAFEVIIVDGSSRDQTIKAIQSHRGQLNLQVVVSKRRGVSLQRNIAARHATSEHLIFLDADVVPEWRFLEKLKKSLELTRPDFATAPNIPLSKKAADKAIFAMFNRLVRLSEFFVPSACGTFIYVRKRAFRSIGGFNEDAVWGEDIDLSRRLSRKGHRFAFLSDPKLYVSVRRLDKEGRLRCIKYFIKGMMHTYGREPVKDRAKLNYEFGHY